MKPTSKLILAALAAFAIAGSASAATVLLTDNFDDNPNNNVSTFNNNLASTQTGSLATVSYSTQGANWTAQHSSGGRLLVATSNDGNGNGSVSLNNNFATQANATNQPLQITFNIHEVGAYPDTTRWVQFNVGNSQNLPIGDGGVAVGSIFRVNGETSYSGINWAADDLVTIVLSGTGGVGSAFNGNGSVATVSIGANNSGPITLAQQTNAYLTFSAFNYGNDQFGLGTFDNLSISLIPEPSAAALGLLATGGLLLRRRRA